MVLEGTMSWETFIIITTIWFASSIDKPKGLKGNSNIKNHNRMNLKLANLLWALDYCS